MFGSALQGWYRAGTWDTSGGRLDSWTDLSGNSRHLVPYASSTNRPAIQSAWNNNIDAISVAASGGSQGFMNTTFPAFSQPLTIFLVVGVNGSVLDDRVVMGTDNTVSASGQLYLETFTSSDRFMFFGATAGPPYASNTSGPTGGAKILTVLANGATTYVRQNGVSGSAGTIGSSTWGGGMYCGISKSGTQRFAGYYQEIIFVSALASASQYASIESMLADRYGITI